MWAALPLLALPAAVYAAVAAFLLPGGVHGAATAAFARPLLAVTVPSGAEWTLSGGEALVLGALAILFAELLKSTERRDVAIVNHSLSMILAGTCLVAFLFVRAFATSTFMLITAMAVLDMAAGFIATFSASRRG